MGVWFKMVQKRKSVKKDFICCYIVLYIHMESDAAEGSFSKMLQILREFSFKVIFGFIIRRATLFYIIGNVFRKRSKARTIDLYNRLLLVRINGRRIARARIRFQVHRHHLLQNSFKQRRHNCFDFSFNNI